MVHWAEWYGSYPPDADSSSRASSVPLVSLLFSPIRELSLTQLSRLRPVSPASGKSTLACALELALLQAGKRAFRLDGDNVRFGLNKDLGFSPKDREENIRRVGEVANLLSSSSTITLTAFISPYLADRSLARGIHEKSNIPFVEVFVDAPLETVEKRDPKGLYKKAREGVIKEFTGISAPYEAPLNPEVHIKTAEVDIQTGVDILIKYLTEMGYISESDKEDGTKRKAETEMEKEGKGKESKAN